MDYTLIKDLLKERGMTFQELSDKLGVQRLEAVSGALGVPVWRLFTVEPKPEIYGTIVYEGQVYSVNAKEDLLKIASLIINK